MYMIEISEDKLCSISEHIEKGLRYMGKAMQCIDELEESHERRGHREYDDEDWDEEKYGHRMPRGKGRYSKY